MIELAIIIDEKKIDAKQLMKLKNIVGLSLSELRLKISQENPIFQQDILEGETDEHVRVLRNIISFLRETSSSNRIYELPEDETFDSCENVEVHQMDLVSLEKMLIESEAELERQFKIMDRESDNPENDFDD